MPVFRNISDEDRVVPIGGGWVKVPVGGQIDVPHPDTYWQTGDQGEEPIFEVVGKAKPKTKGSETVSNDEEGK